jgi:hypothetical protein
MSGGVAGGGGGDKVTVTAEWRQRRRSPALFTRTPSNPTPPHKTHS